MADVPELEQITEVPESVDDIVTTVGAAVIKKMNLTHPYQLPIEINISPMLLLIAVLGAVLTFNALLALIFTLIGRSGWASLPTPSQMRRYDKMKLEILEEDLPYDVNDPRRGWVKRTKGVPGVGSGVTLLQPARQEFTVTVGNQMSRDTTMLIGNKSTDLRSLQV